MSDTITDEQTETTAAPKRPAGAKKPADRKPKKDATSTVTYKGVTVSPLPDMADDFRLLADYGSMQEEEDGLVQVALMRSVLHRLLGKAAAERALTELAKSGKVTIDDASGLINTVLEAQSPNS